MIEAFRTLGWYAILAGFTLLAGTVSAQPNQAGEPSSVTIPDETGRSGSVVGADGESVFPDRIVPSEQLLVGRWEAVITERPSETVRFDLTLLEGGTGTAGYQVVDSPDAYQIIIEWEWLGRNDAGVARFRWREPSWESWREWAVVLPNPNQMIYLATPGAVLHRVE